MAPAPAAGAAALLARSVYVSQLRRAFLLRVHPDRFRTHPAAVRSQQAALVQALSNRLTDPDFVAWQTTTTTNTATSHSSSASKQQQQPQQHPLPYLVERRDGSFLRSALVVTDPVDAILRSMADALEQSGAAAMPVPPPPPIPTPPSSSTSNLPPRTNAAESSSTRSDGWQYDALFSNSSSFTSSTSSNTIDHRYDVQSRRGRDLRSFLLPSLDPSSSWHQDIAKRRMDRTDAHAVASQVRQLYGFQAVDAATSLGWSSRSTTVLLRQLVALYDEHHNRLPISSYHPFRLELSPSVPPSPHAHTAMATVRPQTSNKTQSSSPAQADDDHPALDVYGGVLRIHPAATPLQWLESFQLVNTEHVHALQKHRTTLQHRIQDLAPCLGGVRLVKGHTCSSFEYHAFVKLLHEGVFGNGAGNGAMTTTTTTSLPALEPIRVTVEAPRSVRVGGIVAPDGSVRVHAGLDATSVAEAIAKHGSAAREKARHIATDRETCRHIIRILQDKLGVQRVSTRNASVAMTHFRTALVRLLSAIGGGECSSSSNPTTTAAETESIPLELLQSALAGNSLSIANSGHFCHLGDDGSIVIPHDWR